MERSTVEKLDPLVNLREGNVDKQRRTGRQTRPGECRWLRSPADIAKLFSDDTDSDVTKIAHAPVLSLLEAG